MKALFFVFLSIVSASAHAGWLSKATPVPTVAPTPMPTPVNTLRHCLLQLKKDKKLVAYAVVDAYTKVQQGQLQAWQMQVTYFLPAPKGKPMASLSRNYGNSVGDQAGTERIHLELAPGVTRFSLPTLDGQHLIPMDGRYIFDARYDLSGTAKVALPPPSPKQLAAAKKAGKKLPTHEVWEAKSVRSFTNMGQTMHD